MNESNMIKNDNETINFVASSEPLKVKKKNPLIFGIIISALLIVICLVGYFVIYPLLLRKTFNNPEKIFNKAIDIVQEKADEKIDEWYSNNFLTSLRINVDSDYETIKSFSGYDYTFKLGINSYSKDVELGYNMKNDESDIFQDFYTKNNDLYESVTGYDDLMFLGNIQNNELNDFYTKFTNKFHNSGNVDNNDFKYVVNKISNSFKESIDNNLFTQEETKIDIKDKSYKVFKCQYKMDNELVLKTKDKILNDLFEDEKALQIVSDLTGMSKEEIENKYNNLDIEDDYVLEINVYSRGIKGEIIGLEIVDNKVKNIHYYSYKDCKDIKVYGVLDKDLYMTINYEKDDANISVVYGLDKIDLVVHNYKDTNKSLDYNAIYNGQKINGNGSLSYELSDKVNTIKLNIDGTIDSYFIKLDMELNYDKDAEVANINPGSSKILDAQQYSSVMTQYKNIINNSPFGVFYETSFGINDPDITGDYSIILGLLDYLPIE